MRQPKLSPHLKYKLYKQTRGFQEGAMYMLSDADVKNRGSEFREMFVIDPEDEDVLYKISSSISEGLDGDTMLTPDELRDVLFDALTEDPKPEEPKNLGAKVVDNGVLYEARVAKAENTGGMVWYGAGTTVGKDWDGFSADVKIVFTGYHLPEEA